MKEKMSYFVGKGISLPFSGFMAVDLDPVLPIHALNQAGLSSFKC